MTETVGKKQFDDSPVESDAYSTDRRSSKRRTYTDRRVAERKKRFLMGVVLPVCLGVVATGIVSWAVFITHTTFTISAGYEETFKRHLERQATDAVRDDIRMDSMVLDYNSKILKLNEDMTEGFDELRKQQTNIYNLLVHHEAKRGAEKDQ
jgi:hypothetical protein